MQHITTASAIIAALLLAPGAALGQSASYPVYQCTTPVTSTTAFIWAVDRKLMFATNLADGSRFEIADIRKRTGDQYERLIMHKYTSTYGIEVDLFFTLDDDGDGEDDLDEQGNTVMTIKRQVLTVGGPLGSRAARHTYNGECWRKR